VKEVKEKLGKCAEEANRMKKKKKEDGRKVKRIVRKKRK
jgi:hypothetical protein